MKDIRLLIETLQEHNEAIRIVRLIIRWGDLLKIHKRFKRGLRDPMGGVDHM